MAKPLRVQIQNPRLQVHEVADLVETLVAQLGPEAAAIVETAVQAAATDLHAQARRNLDVHDTWVAVADLAIAMRNGARALGYRRD